MLVIVIEMLPVMHAVRGLQEEAGFEGGGGVEYAAF